MEIAHARLFTYNGCWEWIDIDNDGEHGIAWLRSEVIVVMSNSHFPSELLDCYQQTGD